jgi:D-alanine transaminase
VNETAYLNGQFLPRDKAQISADDRGFIFADGIYEVIKYYNGTPFRFDDHLKRMKNSLSAISLNFNCNNLQEIFFALIEKNNLKRKHAGVYCQVTRGANTRIHSFPGNPSPSVYAFSFELPSFTGYLHNGIKVITHEDIRWLRCDIKSISLLPNIMLFNQAVEKGAGECILIRNGWVTEATHSNVLAVKNEQVITHPLSNMVLQGITRNAIEDICARRQIDFIEEPINERDLFKVDELMITSTGNEITPVVQVDDRLIGNGRPGKMTQFLQSEFFQSVKQ